MDNSAFKILVVEDEPELRELIATILQDKNYQVTQAGNGNEAINELARAQGDYSLVISDILMPEMDGYELCTQVKSDDITQSIPFIFLSSLETLEEKIKGFDAGGNDYITKPVEMEELAYKVKRILETAGENKQLKDQLQYSNGAALEAITYSSDLGQILEFYKKALGAKDFYILAKNVFSATSAMGLDASIQILAPEGIITVNENGTASPLESNVMELARKKTRFFDFGARTIINYSDFSLLIKNMPLENPQRYGTLKDVLGALCDGIEAGVKAILADNAESKKAEILKTVQDVIDDTVETFTALQKENVEAIEDMMELIEEAFLSLGLTESQEERLRGIVSDHMTKTNEAFYKGMAVNNKFEEIKSKLTQILNIRT